MEREERKGVRTKSPISLPVASFAGTQVPSAKPTWPSKQQKKPKSSVVAVAFQRDQLSSAQAGAAWKAEMQLIAEKIVPLAFKLRISEQCLCSLILLLVPETQVQN